MTITIQMLQAVADSARALTDSIQAIVDDCAEQLTKRKATGENENAVMNEAFDHVKPHEASAQSAPADEAPKLTLVELRAYVAERSSPENRPKIKAILTGFGVSKLTELKEEQYTAVMAEVAKACQS